MALKFGKDTRWYAKHSVWSKHGEHSQYSAAQYAGWATRSEVQPIGTNDACQWLAASRGGSKEHTATATFGDKGGWRVA